MQHVRLTRCVVDLRDGRLSGGEEGSLTPRELHLLRYLVERPAQTLTKAQLLEEVFGYRSGTRSRAPDKAMHSLGPRSRWIRERPTTW
ncbi:MAG: winged helix-turn-helix domain-containing protein [Myxococcota bacterium]